MATKRQVESIATILVKEKGRDGAIDYCKAKVSKYEERNEKIKFSRYGVGELEANKVMIEFYLAVSLMIQTIKSQDHDS